MESESIRLDIWLWAARFYKTRALASKNIKLGRVLLHGQRAKPATAIKTNDTLSIQKGIQIQTVIVLSTSKQRSSASIARTLYAETQASVQQREQQKLQAQTAPKIQRDKNKPDKRGVRQNIKIKRNMS